MIQGRRRWDMTPMMRIAGFLVACMFAAYTASAQQVVAGKDLPAAARVLDSAPSKNSLPCSIEFSGRPRLDFLFRFTEGFGINCRLGNVMQPGSKLFAVVRVKPEAGGPTVMLESFDLPAAHRENSSGLFAAPSRLVVSMSGGFAMGPGRYTAEVVLTDLHGHTYRKRRELNASSPRGGKDVPVALDGGVVAPLLNARWDGALASKGLRVTVLLNAYGPGGRSRLYAWDVAYLMQSLAALLGQLPCQSVKLIAFNLDNQEEIFRRQALDAEGFARLEKALEQMDAGAIGYHALTRGAWANFLVDMAEREVASQQAPDALIFLGPWGSHEWEKVPGDLLRKVEGSGTRIFYFEYFERPGGAPDGVERLTRDLHGTVFAIHSPETLAQAIKRTQSRMNVLPAD